MLPVYHNRNNDKQISFIKERTFIKERYFFDICDSRREKNISCLVFHKRKTYLLAMKASEKCRNNPSFTKNQGTNTSANWVRTWRELRVNQLTDSINVSQQSNTVWA